MHIPRYFSNAGYRQFANFYLPTQSQWPNNWVVFCPPIGEELNKSRALVAHQARKLSALGYGVVVADLHGTGDSPYGLEASCADWHHWIDQFDALLLWLRQQGATRVTLWGLRLGALLALEVHQKQQSLDRVTTPAVDVPELVFWQPVLSGKTFMTQFLRLRTAAAMMVGTEPETVSGLRAQATNEGALEVAGYRLSAQLIEQIDRLNAQHYCLSESVSIHWFDISRRVDKPLPAIQSQLLERWRGQGACVQIHRVEGDAFWAAQELASVPALITATTQAMSKNSPLMSSSDTVTVAPRGDCLSQRLPLADGEIEAITFDCDGHSLISLIHHPQQFNGRAVVLVVGGPQYRVGSHRQFVELAQALADDGYLVARFDCRGMGDSEGECAGFESIDSDISVAVDGLYSVGLNIQSVSLWGLCDAATAISFYAATDSRIENLVLLNPWVRSDAGLAKAKMKHYYTKRLFEKVFWKKLLSGRLNVTSAFNDFRQTLVSTIRNTSIKQTATKPLNVEDSTDSARDTKRPLIEQLYQSLSAFDGRVLVLLSGRDLTAQEFDVQAKAYKPMRLLLDSGRVDLQRMADADHTFSRVSHKRKVEDITSQWLGCS